MTERPHFHFSLCCIGEGNGSPLRCSCLENPRDGGAWWAAVYGVAQSWTRLKWLSIAFKWKPEKKKLKKEQICKASLLLSHFSRVGLLWHHRQQPTRLPCPWGSPGKNTGMGCHFLLQCMKVKSESEVAQSCLTLSNALDCSLPGSSIHGIFQARVLEWDATAFSEDISTCFQIFKIMSSPTPTPSTDNKMGVFWLFTDRIIAIYIVRTSILLPWWFRR